MLLFSRYMGVSSTILKKSRWFFFFAIHIWLGPNCFSNFSLRECPLFHLPFVYFFKTSNFYSNLYLSIYVCFFKVHQLFPKHGVLLAWPKMTSPWRQYFNKIILPSPCSIQGNSHLKMAACKRSLLLGISLWFFCFYHDHNGRVQRQTDSLSFYDLVKLCIDIFTSETPWCGKYKNSFVRRDMTRSEMYYVNSLNNAVFAEKKLMFNLFNFLRG